MALSQLEVEVVNARDHSRPDTKAVMEPMATELMEAKVLTMELMETELMEMEVLAMELMAAELMAMRHSNILRRCMPV